MKQEFCISCEVEFLRKEDKFGTVCQSCFTKSKRRDPLMQAAIRQVVVAVVPTLCPHDGERTHVRCRYSRDTAGRFSVVVLNKKLEPIEIHGPFSERTAERHAKRIRGQIDRRGK